MIMDEGRELSSSRLEIVELCVASIKQLANTKQTFREFLAFSETNKELLTVCIRRVFQLSDSWSDSKNELLRFKKILDSEQPKKAPVVKKPTEENLDNFKAIELMEGKEDRSIKMAPIVKIRNNLYYTVVGCFKAGFSLEFLLNDC